MALGGFLTPYWTYVIYVRPKLCNENASEITMCSSVVSLLQKPDILQLHVAYLQSSFW